MKHIKDISVWLIAFPLEESLTPRVLLTAGLEQSDLKLAIRQRGQAESLSILTVLFSCATEERALDLQHQMPQCISLPSCHFSLNFRKQGSKPGCMGFGGAKAIAEKAMRDDAPLQNNLSIRKRKVGVGYNKSEGGY